MLSRESMNLITQTLSHINSGSKEIAFNHFDNTNVNILDRFATKLSESLNEIDDGKFSEVINFLPVKHNKLNSICEALT